MPPEKGLHPIPSVIDLPAHLEMETEGRTGTLGVPAAAGSRLVHRGGERTRRDVEETQRFVMGGGEEKARVGMSTGDVEVVKHYDADGMLGQLCLLFARNLSNWDSYHEGHRVLRYRASGVLRLTGHV